MNVIMWILVIIGVVKTVSFSIWCFRDKNNLGGIGVMLLAIASVILGGIVI